MNRNIVTCTNLCIVLMLLLSASACKAPAPEPTATPTVADTATASPVPTDTPKPTQTPAPTNTPEPTATETATPKPTQDLAATTSWFATQKADNVVNKFKENLETNGITLDKGSLAWFSTSTFDLKFNLPQTQFLEPMAEKLVVSDFILQMDMSWEATGVPFCGLLFRSEPSLEKGKNYQLIFMRFSGLPAWDIEFWDGNDFIKNVTDDVRFSDAIKLEDKSTNHIILVAEGNKFTVYVNDKRQGSFFDFSESRMEGRLAYYGYEESGKTSCKYSNLVIWTLK